MGKPKRAHASKPRPQANSAPKKIEFRLPDVKKDRQIIDEYAREEIDELLGREPAAPKPLPRKKQGGKLPKPSNNTGDFINPFPEEFQKPKNKSGIIEPEQGELEPINRESAFENLASLFKVVKEVKGKKR